MHVVTLHSLVIETSQLKTHSFILTFCFFFSSFKLFDQCPIIVKEAMAGNQQFWTVRISQLLMSNKKGGWTIACEHKSKGLSANG